MATTTLTSTGTRALAEFVADLRYDDIPAHVIDGTKDLMIDWLGSALAGKGARPVVALEQFAAEMGPRDGPSEIIPGDRNTSPLFAALINGAASHVAEQDDVHNGAVFHPGTVVFPAVLAVAQAEDASGRDLLVAAIAGYEVGIRVGEFLGRSHYKIFHTTGTAGTLASAAAVSRLLGLDADATQHALGSAGTQAAGLWEFLRDAADSKQLHTAKAAADGLLSAYLARSGVTGARRILEGAQGLAAGMSTDADPSRLTDGLGTRWATIETSYKLHASCRHTHPAADALLSLMEQERLSHDQIARVTARVHQGAIDVLGQVTEPTNVHQAKFSMGTVLGLIAVHGSASLDDFEHALDDARGLGVSQEGADGSRRRGGRRLSAPLARSRGCRDDGRKTASRASGRAEGRSGEFALAFGARSESRCGLPASAAEPTNPRFERRFTESCRWIRRIAWRVCFDECAKRPIRPRKQA